MASLVTAEIAARTLGRPAKTTVSPPIARPGLSGSLKSSPIDGQHPRACCMDLLALRVSTIPPSLCFSRPRFAGRCRLVWVELA